MLASDDNIIRHCLDIGLLWEHQQQLHRRRGGESSARNSVSKNLTGEYEVRSDRISAQTGGEGGRNGCTDS